ncbi:cytochrome c biogenesis protein CcdA [Pseudomonas benzenivorans]|uniref:Sulfite exporter TauE/SafE family protein n=1 Tax=Pseudomonas benzenivorans TaxID=556533 RepID=A0ABY5HAT8_9PSED|nr:cytochrome c biogenesis protein CcdA [Pseudomonas benzenivorans]UTW08936.1 sulfite exporter TauE/SafE family protein [Pseudomonas benzenivorans]
MELEALRLAITQGTLVAVGLSLMAGLFFSLSPLALAALPVPLAYVTRARSPQDAARYGLSFIAGMLAALALLGLLAGLGGGWVQDLLGRYWGLVLGPWLILLGLLWLGRIRLSLPAPGFKARRPSTAWGAFALGVPFSVAVCPVCAPALIVLLGAAAASGSPALGALLLASFAVGRAIPLAIATTAVGGLQQLQAVARFGQLYELCGGIGLVLTGLYLLNAYFRFLPALAG